MEKDDGLSLKNLIPSQKTLHLVSQVG